MAKVRANRRVHSQSLPPENAPSQIRRGSKLPTLLLGFTLGIVAAWMFVALPFDASTDLRNLDSPARGNSPGWNPIHVFYGEESGLNTEGKTYFAQVHQDEVLLDLIGDHGYFVDLAANDAKEFSNTLALERAGWDGLCIEPNPAYWYGLSHRKCQVAAALVGATKQQVDVKFRGVYGGIVGKLDEKMANYKKEPNAPVEKRYTVPFLEVLRKFNVPQTIDYMSLDVEGAELMIMKDFPFEQYTIRIMTVERPSQELRNLLQSKNYVYLKDLVWWGETLWAHKSTGFTPTHPQIVKIKEEQRN